MALLRYLWVYFLGRKTLITNLGMRMTREITMKLCAREEVKMEMMGR